jgi:hypothetical protein
MRVNLVTLTLIPLFYPRIRLLHTRLNHMHTNHMKFRGSYNSHKEKKFWKLGNEMRVISIGNFCKRS